MNKKVKAQWVAALRSGKYEQGTRYLKYIVPSGTKHCCLGVLEELHNEVEGGGANLIKRGTLYGSTMHWAGLENPRGELVTINGEKLSLASHNDGSSGVAAKTFAQIADAIEAQL